MKKSILFILIIVATCSYFTQGQALNNVLNVKSFTTMKWNSENGISYSQVPGANLGVTSFEVLSNDRISYLCNSTNEIIIAKASTNNVIRKFPVAFAPRDFCYDNNLFYVLSELKIDVYNEYGNHINNFIFSQNYAGTERIARANNSTYLLLASGNSLLIESNGLPIKPNEFEGWISYSGNRVATELTSSNTYKVKFFSILGLNSENSFQTDHKVAGVYLVGVNNNRIILDVQTFLTESPISVERKIISISFDNENIKGIEAELKIPNMYYVISNKEFTLSSEGMLYNMITAPEGVFVYSLSELISGKGITHYYPDFLTQKSYHFNDHLINIELK